MLCNRNTQETVFGWVQGMGVELEDDKQNYNKRWTGHTWGPKGHKLRFMIFLMCFFKSFFWCGPFYHLYWICSFFFFLMCWFFGHQACGIEPGGLNLGIETALPALKGKVLTTRDLQGRPISCSFFKKKIVVRYTYWYHKTGQLNHFKVHGSVALSIYSLLLPNHPPSSHCGFKVCFSENWCDWIPFHVCISSSRIFLSEVSIQIHPRLI